LTTQAKTPSQVRSPARSPLGAGRAARAGPARASGGRVSAACRRHAAGGALSPSDRGGRAGRGARAARLGGPLRRAVVGQVGQLHVDAPDRAVPAVAQVPAAALLHFVALPPVLRVLRGTRPHTHTQPAAPPASALTTTRLCAHTDLLCAMCSRSKCGAPTSGSYPHQLYEQWWRCPAAAGPARSRCATLEVGPPSSAQGAARRGLRAGAAGSAGGPRSGGGAGGPGRAAGAHGQEVLLAGLAEEPGGAPGEVVLKVAGRVHERRGHRVRVLAQELRADPAREERRAR